MIVRGKFRSLTLINWNGFFARTFELDDLVTTLSGGNGAGKSTTMAAFVTALIPDLTLLHFRNTTEAGSTSGSRDRGLYGKLKPGVCYAVLDIINSKRQRILCAVRLQQIAGRDKKVDIKPFILQGVPMSEQPTQILTELLDNNQARVLPLTEVKERLENREGIIFKQFNAITDYHSQMFDLGILAKRLRTAADRSKYYKLIEASLYGGISSAITRSLRDYLLPENSGVRKAFQDMEAALRENRMTLEAIRMTQSDRNLFKHLINESTDYVASDYMRNSNERREHVEKALIVRQRLFNTYHQLNDLQQQHIEMSKELQDSTLGLSDLETDLQSASDHLNLVQTAVRHQEKIERYQNDVDELKAQLEEQQEVVTELNERLIEMEAETQASEEEVDEIKSQLADYQQALGVQQTRAIQYQHALQALSKAQALSQQSALTVDNVDEWLDIFTHQEQEITEKLLDLEQKISVSQAAAAQFDQALSLISGLTDNVTRENAWQKANDFFRQLPALEYHAQQYSTLQTELREIEQKQFEQQEAQKQYEQFCKRYGQTLNAEVLPELQHELQEQLEEQEQQVTLNNEQRFMLYKEQEQLHEQIRQLTTKAPLWFAGQEALQQLQHQTETVLSSAQKVTNQIQILLEQERTWVVERDSIEQRKQQLDEQITRLSQPSGAEDNRLITLAERFGGVLLSEIYDDVTIEDAPYFSALYGPSRHAIVVPELMAIREQLADLQDAPDDLYFIEGDPLSFDDGVFETEELKEAVLVKSGDRQWRYSHFPKVPLFGRAARETQLEILSAERDELQEKFAKLSFDVQKIQRLQQHFSQFVGRYLGVAFDPNPVAEAQVLGQRRIEIQRQLTQLDDGIKKKIQKINQLMEKNGLLQRLNQQLHLLVADDLHDRIDELNDALSEAKYAINFITKNEKNITQLQKVVSVLQSDPEQNEHIQTSYEQLKEKQRFVKQQLFAISEVISRKLHFSYQYSVDMLTESSELSDKLRIRLTKIEQLRNESRQALKEKRQEVNRYQQTLMSLKSAYESKSEILSELEQEIQALGVRADHHTLSRAEQRRNDLQMQLGQNRERCHQLEKTLILSESEMEQLQKMVRRDEKEYQQLRQQVVQTKLAWQNVMKLVKENGMERRLHRHELGYVDAETLRSRSDKALGALRLAVADNELLRDALRKSEDPKKPEQKITFFIAVYQHLRERIRQDIIKTDDPIEAIEQMEIELSRLTEELTTREQKLAISAKSVANIIRKTIQREQNRIRMLNQGLQSVSFGQVNSVRLNVNIHDSHALLLSVLAEQQEQHQDLFNNQSCTFSEALAKLYQRLNPQFELGQRSAQTLGQELLDYRNYLGLEIEVNRGTDGWLRAESGALSTGEAIGTGMSILVMVVQSWEDESKRLRGKDISPCRLLFLDEAARLDAKSIATLFELCERLEMQLIIAAPENISPEKGTTYKLVRKVFNNQEIVHVVGLKGFMQPETQQKDSPVPIGT